MKYLELESKPSLDWTSKDPVVALPGESSIDERWHYLRCFGQGSLAYSSMQPKLDHYLVPGIGYVPFALISDANVPVCLSDPICSSKDTPRLLSRFFDCYDYPIFIHISQDVARMLSELGFLINEIGTETIIEIPKFTLAGKDKEFLRSQRNRARKDGVTVTEKSCKEIFEVLKSISAAWLAKKTVHSHELSFIVRPAVYVDEPDVRIFIARRNGTVIGFVVFDPMYKDERVIGYVANTLRSVDNLSYSVCDCIIMEAMQVFKNEGIDTLSLGYSPLYKVEDGGTFNYSKLLKAIFNYTYKHSNCVYEFKSLAFHKSRYRPDQPGCREVKVYCACRPPVPFALLGKVFELMGVDLKAQIAAHIMNRVKNAS